MNEFNAFDNACVGLQSHAGTLCFSLPPPSANRFYVWAERLFESGRYSEALDAYNECLNLDPSNANAIYKRGLTKGVLKNVEGSLADLDIVLFQSVLKGGSLLEKSDPVLSTKQLMKACPYSYDLFEAVDDFKEINYSLNETAEDIEQATAVLSLYMTKLNRKFRDLLAPPEDHRGRRIKKGAIPRKKLGKSGSGPK